MKNLEEYSNSELISLALASSFIIAEKTDLAQQNVLGNFYQTVGQVVLLIAAQNQNIQALEENPSEIDKSISNDLQKQIDELKEYVEKMKENNLKN
ncbi:hypothetical protein LGK97_02030 [Clostridium sp. CS001]|uniref:hypothetical protein n=1 Tax=Clostridium sp. CS001 TaxID=2880648 RepID=UPI001CF1C88A|nr:hypothetical protein [Clostridium sp. CS001]MCB2288542.1 hypothetical protein [Clostridium sp. CS001]